MDDIVYYSTGSKPAELWDAYQHARQAWRDRVEAFKQANGGRDLFMFRSPFDHVRSIAGIADTTAEVPTGWSRSKSRDYLVPNRRSKAGREIADQIRRLHSPAVIGMFQDGTGLPAQALHVPGIHCHDGTVWLIYSRQPQYRNGDGWEDWPGNEHWAIGKLSAFHASLESFRAAHPKAATS